MVANPSLSLTYWSMNIPNPSSSSPISNTLFSVSIFFSSWWYFLDSNNGNSFVFLTVAAGYDPKYKKSTNNKHKTPISHNTPVASDALALIGYSSLGPSMFNISYL